MIIRSQQLTKNIDCCDLTSLVSLSLWTTMSIQPLVSTSFCATRRLPLQLLLLMHLNRSAKVQIICLLPFCRPSPLRTYFFTQQNKPTFLSLRIG